MGASETPISLFRCAMLYTAYFIMLIGGIGLLSYWQPSRPSTYDALGQDATQPWSPRRALQQVLTWNTMAWTGGSIPVFERPKRHGYFLHITDMHIDEDYLPGSSVSSDCHQPPASANTSSAGYLGAPGQECDAPLALAEKTLDWIARTWRDKIDFVVWTGDNARHDWDKKRRRKRKHIYHLNEKMADMMRATFWPTARDPRHIPLVPTLGNNDVYPHNTMGGPDVDGDLLDYFERLWRQWIPTDQRAVFRQGGYFGVDVGPRLRVLSLNTMYFYAKNDAVPDCRMIGTPAYHQIRWFQAELQRARRAHVSVYVIGHVPPSPKHYRTGCFQDYIRIASNYPDVLSGHFYGHLNMDHFLLYDARLSEELASADAVASGDTDDDGHVHSARNLNKYVNWLKDMYASIDALDNTHTPPMMQPPVIAVQVAPSVLPVYFPAVRIYRYQIHDDDDRGPCPHHDKKPHGTLLGYDQYYANITDWEANLQGTPQDTPLDYQLEYTSEEAYQLEDLTVSSYFELAQRMTEDDSDDADRLWSSYLRNMFVQFLGDTKSPA